VFYTYQSLIAQNPAGADVGDYEDLLPDTSFLWCYRRQWQGQTLMVAANLSLAAGMAARGSQR
jgi:trehalose-6-phosphate hydrolase